MSYFCYNATAAYHICILHETSNLVFLLICPRRQRMKGEIAHVDTTTGTACSGAGAMQ